MVNTKYSLTIYIIALTNVAPLLTARDIVPRGNIDLLVVLSSGQPSTQFNRRQVSKILKKIGRNYDFVIPVGIGKNYNKNVLGKIKGRFDMESYLVKPYGCLPGNIESLCSKYENRYATEKSLLRKKRHLEQNYFRLTM